MVQVMETAQVRKNFSNKNVGRNQVITKQHKFLIPSIVFLLIQCALTKLIQHVQQTWLPYIRIKLTVTKQFLTNNLGLNNSGKNLFGKHRWVKEFLLWNMLKNFTTSPVICLGNHFWTL